MSTIIKLLKDWEEFNKFQDFARRQKIVEHVTYRDARDTKLQWYQS